jgi:hypothetical protein
MVRNLIRGLVQCIRLIREYLYYIQRVVRHWSGVHWGDSREKLHSLTITLLSRDKVGIVAAPTASRFWP